MAELRYTKDGVPIYDGTPELFVPYRRAALIYAETVEWKKRTLVGPRLQAALEGSARMVVEHKTPGWISHPNGASQLLECLKQQVRSPTLAEAGRTMSRFFYGIKRRRGEGMAAWIVRHDEALLEAKRTLAEAIQEYGPGSKVSSSKSSTSWRSQYRGYTRPQGSSESGGTHPDPEEPGNLEEENEDHQDHEEETGETREDSEAAGDWWDSWWSNDWSHWNEDRYTNTPSWWGTQPSSGGLTWATWDASATASAQAERFLPDFVIAWLLLQRSGLDTTEKSVIVANLRNNFSIQKVKEALKLTWPDEELRKRDSGKNGAMFAADEEALLAGEDEAEPPEAPTWDDPEEGYAYQALEDDAQEALAAPDDARRTLKDAREKQAQMRRNRGFFSQRNSGGERPSGSRPPIKCFRCGGNHMRRDCPQNNSGSSNDQRVHFVFSATTTTVTAEPDGNEKLSTTTEANMLALDEVVAAGNAIIDGGATSSLGSEDALQQVVMLNWKATGQDSIDIIPGEKPSFRFGNNAQHTCLSTAMLRLPIECKDSRMKVHIHDIPGQPVLLSVKSLRALGAVIDFSNDQAVFKALDPRAVVSLETTSSGHQLFPLARDVLEGATPLDVPFTSFHQYVKAHAHRDKYNLSTSRNLVIPLVKPDVGVVNKMYDRAHLSASSLNLRPPPRLSKYFMPSTGTTKAEMQQKLIRMGETPPHAWTKVQLATRIAELQAAEEQPMTEREASKMINRAKTKQALMDLLAEHNLEHSKHQTMDQLRAVMLRYLMEAKVPATYENYMGFGKYSHLTYGQVLTHYQSYTDWTITTAATEKECHWRLRRYAQWANGLSRTEREKIYRMASSEIESEAQRATQRGYRYRPASQASSSEWTESRWEVATMETAPDQEMIPATSSRDPAERLEELETELRHLRDLVKKQVEETVEPDRKQTKSKGA
ncbi:hypothetical protein AK812_SmicGene36174 [Symbiodinium microadriaticum]|uniref:CCHC-type domain-containing protein n=1 Tax=Symbiodinium microadriaticum TaxID=2951 RepID=A0A1Q9CJK4_SYMMI|nr:hypothetical protein AK812_SmicGene36174 [Symbiodinium microadriaticum]